MLQKSNQFRFRFAVAAALAGMGSIASAEIQRVTLSGATTAPGQGTLFTSTALAAVDSAGVSYIGTFTVGGQARSGLYNFANGVTTVIADINTATPGGEAIRSIVGNGDYINGAIVFAANTSAGQKLYRYTAGSGLQTLVSQGDALGGADSTVGTFVARAIAGDATSFAFTTTRSDTTPGLYVGLNNIPTVLADNRTRSPIAETGDFQGFPEISYNNGRTAFVGLGLDPDAVGAAPEPAGVFISTPGNPLEIVAGRNFLIPGSDEFRFTEFERPRIYDDGRVSFAGGFIEEDAPDPEESERFLGVFLRNLDGTWKKYIKTEMQLPGLHDDLDEFTGYSLDAGYNVFCPQDLSGGSYIYFENSAGVFTRLIDSYEMLDGKQLSRLRLVADSGQDGIISFRATFADGSTGVYSAALPEPTSMLALAGTVVLAGRRRRAV